MLSDILARVRDHSDRTLIADANGSYTGRQLLHAASSVARSLGPIPPTPGRVALLASPGIGYVAGLLGIWMRGAMAVPLCPEHPPAEIAYVLEDADVAAVVCDDALQSLLPPTARPIVGLPIRPLIQRSSSRSGSKTSRNQA